MNVRYDEPVKENLLAFNLHSRKIIILTTTINPLLVEQSKQEEQYSSQFNSSSV